MNHVYIVAGTHAQAVHWIEASGRRRRDCVIIDHPDVIRGASFATGAVVYVGTWLDRTDITEVQRRISAANRSHVMRIGL